MNLRVRNKFFFIHTVFILNGQRIQPGAEFRGKGFDR